MHHATTDQRPDRRPQHQQRPRRHPALAWLALPLVLAATLLAAVPAQAASADRAGCVRRDLPVTLTATPAATVYRLAGWLCRPHRASAQVQLMVAGLTYTHQYWTGLDQRTNQAAAALTAGDAVYLIDRTGTGASDQPPADQVTTTSEATVIHQAVRALRDGTLGRYRTVAGIGHSYGSVLWMAETAAYHDVNALVLTGLLHDIDPAEMTRFTTDLHPAADDPQLAGTPTPAGYLTTRPGARAGYFLDPHTTEPGAAAWDERTKTTATTGELTFTPDQLLSYSRAITAPVLLVVGSSDDLFCGPGLPCTHATDICLREYAAYPDTKALTAVVVAATGHSLNLHTTAAATHDVINNWLRHRQTGSESGIDPATCRPSRSASTDLTP